MRLPNHQSSTFPLTVLALACTLSAARSANAAFIMNFDEYGKATVQTATGATVPVPSLGNIIDPFDPASGIKPLAYNLVGVIPGVAPVDGDVLLREPASPNGLPSDLLRWTHGLLLVYSELPEAGEINPPPADVGLPTLLQSNTLFLDETGPENGTNGLFGYTPVGNMPGTYPTPPGPATYNFVSDAVPEPTSIAALSLGAMVLLRRRPRQ